MSVAPDPSSALTATDGRSLGKRGTRTRRALLEATAARLERHGIRELRVVDIAREVGTSPATFYQYFRDVEAAVLVLAEEVAEQIMPLADGLGSAWSQRDGLDAARELVDRYIEVFDRNRAVLRTRNLAAQEGDARFREVRAVANRRFMLGFAALVEAGQANGAVAPEITPAAAAAALTALLERMAAFHTELEPYGVSRDALVETTARIIFQTVTGTSG